MANNPIAAICSGCNAELREGQSALYDDYKDQHFCDRDCYDGWYDANVDIQKREYYLLNVNTAEL